MILGRDRDYLWRLGRDGPAGYQEAGRLFVGQSYGLCDHRLVFPECDRGHRVRIYQMLNHGISTGALFLLVGMIYERRHTREITQYGGITKVMPLFAVVFMIVTLSSVALPGTNGFIGEFLILLGSWKANPGFGGHFRARCDLWRGLHALDGSARVLWADQKSGERKASGFEFPRAAILAPLVVAIFFMGVYPNFFFSKMGPSIDRFLSRSQGDSVRDADGNGEHGMAYLNLGSKGRSDAEPFKRFIPSF